MRITRRSGPTLFCGVALFVFLFAGSVRAGTATSITGLYTTGQESHTENWWMNVDNHWTASNAEGKAYVLGYSLGATLDTAKWISAGPVGFPSTSVNYAYALTFNIVGTGSGAATNAAITLSLYVDDTATVYVNGVQAAVLSGSTLRTTPTTLTLNSNFVIGNNTISIVVNNAGGASGLMVSSITGVVPEVGAWVPLAGALALFSWFRLRSKKKFPLAA